VSSFDDGLDEDDDVLPPSSSPLTLLFIFRMLELSVIKFLFFFFLFVGL